MVTPKGTSTTVSTRSAIHTQRNRSRSRITSRRKPVPAIRVACALPSKFAARFAELFSDRIAPGGGA